MDVSADVLLETNSNIISENTTKNIAQQLSETVQKNYGYILNNDIVRKIVENLKVDYPALVEGIIPEHISYSLLKNVMVKLLERGDGLNYLVKTIEVLDSVITSKHLSSLNELAAAVCKMCLLSTCHMLHGLHREMSIVIQEIATPSLEHSTG